MQQSVLIYESFYLIFSFQEFFWRLLSLFEEALSVRKKELCPAVDGGLLFPATESACEAESRDKEFLER